MIPKTLATAFSGIQKSFLSSFEVHNARSFGFLKNCDGNFPEFDGIDASAPFSSSSDKKSAIKSYVSRSMFALACDAENPYSGVSPELLRAFMFAPFLSSHSAMLR